MSDNIIIETRSLTKIYRTGKVEFKALNNVSIKIKKGDFPDWMIEAVANEYRLNTLRRLQDNWRASNFLDAFILQKDCSKTGSMYSRKNLPQIRAWKHKNWLSLLISMEKC